VINLTFCHSEPLTNPEPASDSGQFHKQHEPENQLDKNPPIKENFEQPDIQQSRSTKEQNKLSILIYVKKLF